MTEPASSSAGLAWLVKVYGLKVVAGALGAALMFAALWPRTAREGVARLASAIMGSALWGDALLAWVTNTVAWWPAGSQGSMPVYAAAGAPAWWVLGLLARWLDKWRERGLDELIATLRGKHSG